MPYALSLALVLLLLGGLGFGLWRLSKCYINRWIHRADVTKRCPCGYDLSATPLPRCPECGRAVGFNCTFEDMGISERDVQQHIAAKQKS